MTHFDPDALALIALDEVHLTASERDHLAACPRCLRELTALRRTVDVARSAHTVELQGPADAVWGRIHEDLGLSAAVQAPPLPDPADTGASAPQLSPPVTRKDWLPFAAIWLAIRRRKATDGGPEATTSDSSLSPHL